MGTPQHRFAIIRASGRVENCDYKASVFPGREQSPPYLEVLRTIAEEMMTAGGTYDSPVALLFNGKIVIEDGLSALAYRYAESRRLAMAGAAERVDGEAMPDWYMAWMKARK